MNNIILPLNSSVLREAYSLQSGSYNKYSQFRLDKALATGEVGRFELCHSSEYEILNRLGIEY